MHFKRVHRDIKDRVERRSSMVIAFESHVFVAKSVENLYPNEDAAPNVMVYWSMGIVT
jgi:hypothetical protein